MIHLGTMDWPDQLGLADRLLKLPHSKIRRRTGTINGQPITIVDLRPPSPRFR